MFPSRMGQALAFDDILLVPFGGVASRAGVDLTMETGNLKLQVPVISAPMSTVTEGHMAASMSLHGGLGIIHRYQSLEERLVNFYEDPSGRAGIAVGLNISELELKQVFDAGCSMICIDVANGHDERVVDKIIEIRKYAPANLHIMAGNVATYDAYIDLADAGADSVRVGIGGGSVCTTRIVSGHGLPTLQSVMDVAAFKRPECAVVADGGIRTTGDMVKAFAAGADFVMLGNFLAGTHEAPGAPVLTDAGWVKEYYGMASAKAQEKAGRDPYAIEGAETFVPFNGRSVAERMKEVRMGLGSGCSYSGVDRLADLCDNAEYVTVTQAGVTESKAHAAR